MIAVWHVFYYRKDLSTNTLVCLHHPSGYNPVTNTSNYLVRRSVSPWWSLGKHNSWKQAISRRTLLAFHGSGSRARQHSLQRGVF